MKSLFRNSFFRLATDYWMVGVYLLALAWGIGGATGFRLAAIFCACLVGIYGGAFLFAYFAGMRDWSGQRECGGQSRFLCPHCLHLGDFLGECGECHSHIEAFQLNTKGAFNAACLTCQEIIFPSKIKASCYKCKQPSDPAIYHHRRVGILAVLSTTDFAALRTLNGEQVKISEDGTEFFCRDEDETLQYVLNLENAGSEHKSENYRHAWQHVQQIWIDTGDALQVARQTDALVRRMTDADKLRKIKVLVRQNEIDSVVRLRLEQQFGALSYGIAPEQLFSNAVPISPKLLVEEMVIESTPNLIAESQKVKS
jgi:hypothetical protein